MELFIDRYKVKGDDIDNKVTYVTVDVYKDGEKNPFERHSIILKGVERWK